MKEERKKQKGELLKWTKKVKVTKQEECHLLPEKEPSLDETVSFSLVTCLEELLELIFEQSNLYAHHNGRNVTVTKEEVK